MKTHVIFLAVNISDNIMVHSFLELSSFRFMINTQNAQIREENEKDA